MTLVLARVRSGIFDDEWWANLWGNAGGGIVSAVSFAIVVFVISRVPKWRKPLFGAVSRAVRLLGTVRVTTTARIGEMVNAEREAAVEEARHFERRFADEREAATVARLQDAAIQAEADFQKQLQKQFSGGVATGRAFERESYDEEVRDWKKDVSEAKAAAAAAKADRDETFDALLAEQTTVGTLREQLATATRASAVPTLPLPSPRWSAYPDPEHPGTFVLRNAVMRSVAREVRLETVREYDFEFLDGAHWEDCSGSNVVEFRGKLLSGEVEEGDVWLAVIWYDEKGERQRSEIIMRTITEDDPF